jgi:hypothetical protein
MNDSSVSTTSNNYKDTKDRSDNNNNHSNNDSSSMLLNAAACAAYGAYFSRAGFMANFSPTNLTNAAAVAAAAGLQPAEDGVEIISPQILKRRRLSRVLLLLHL